MPYGVPASHGGDTPQNTAKMKSCVQAVMSKGASKTAAIKICKAQLFGKEK